MKEKVYIHYGNDHFDANRFKVVKTREGAFGIGSKPEPGTGLWGSPVSSTHSWEEWCESQDFNTDKFDKSFKFTVRHPEKILYIDSNKSLDSLFDIYGIIGIGNWPKIFVSPALDFDKMKRDGYVAMEISISSHWRIYDELYGWDCDSIVVFYADEVCVVE